MAARPALTVLVLAAGQGKRLRSKTIKLLHPVAGRPMVAWVVDAARTLGPTRLITVVGHQGEQVRTSLDGLTDRFVEQREQLGTGHAVLQAGRAIERGNGALLLVLNGDIPNLRPSTLKNLVARHRRSGAVLTLLTAEIPDASGYGRIVRDGSGAPTRIVEDGDANADERRIREINCGLYCGEPAALLAALRRVRPDNAQGEYYLTDAVHELIAQGRRVTALVHSDADELLGVNTRQELSRASRKLVARHLESLQDHGVTIVDPSRTWIDPRARIARDTVVWPDVVIEGATEIGEDCVIRSGSRLTDVVLGRGVEIKDHCVVTQSRLGDGVILGPFAHLRPDCVLDDGSRVGNFVEMKKTRLGRGSKANHLTYLGDAEVGPACNVGAGTITCNYDGVAKHKTVLGRGVFIGSGTELVAPVSLGDEAYVGAGSTVTEDVPAGALAIARSRQRNVEGWVKRRREAADGHTARKRG